MKNSLDYPYQCTGCEARWYDGFVEMYCDGSMEELQRRHRIRKCWQFPWEAYHHVIVDIRKPIPVEFFAMASTDALFEESAMMIDEFNRQRLS